MEYPIEREYIIYWHDGSSEISVGTDEKSAFTNAGYGGGAYSAVDYIKRSPLKIIPSFDQNKCYFSVSRDSWDSDEIPFVSCSKFDEWDELGKPIHKCKIFPCTNYIDTFRYVYYFDGKPYRKILRNEKILPGAMHSWENGPLRPIINVDTTGDIPASFSKERDFYNPLPDLKCYFSSGFFGGLTCCKDGCFDSNGYPKNRCKFYPCVKFSKLNSTII